MNQLQKKFLDYISFIVRYFGFIFILFNSIALYTENDISNNFRSAIWEVYAGQMETIKIWGQLLHLPSPRPDYVAFFAFGLIYQAISYYLSSNFGAKKRDGFWKIISSYFIFPIKYFGLILIFSTIVFAWTKESYTEKVREKLYDNYLHIAVERGKPGEILPPESSTIKQLVYSKETYWIEGWITLTIALGIIYQFASFYFSQLLIKRRQ